MKRDLKSPALKMAAAHRPIYMSMGGSIYWFWLGLFMLCSISLDANAGKLNDTSEIVSGDDDTDDGDSISFCLFCFLWSDDDEDAAYESDPGPTTRTESAWLSHPYAQNSDGYAIVRKRHYELIEDPDTGAITRKFKRETLSPANLSLDDGKTVAFTFRGGYWYDWDAVHMSELRLSVDAASLLGVQFRWFEFYENIAPQPLFSETAAVTGYTDETLDTTGLFDLQFRIPLVTEHRGLFRLGVGGLLMHHAPDNHFGAYLSGELKVFPVQPLVAGVDLQLGYIRNAAYIRSEATIGVIMGPLELYGGYHVQAFLGENESVLYNGPGAGIRLWL